jgi:transposase-like protein
VKKRQRRLAGVDELVISLAAKGLTTGEIAAHFADVYGAEATRTISHGNEGTSALCRLPPFPRAQSCQ